MTETCPQCGSPDVLSGACVLSCNACGWHYLDGHPCEVCGSPARSAMGGSPGGGEPFAHYYRCPAHPFTPDDFRRCFGSLVEVIRGVKQ